MRARTLALRAALAALALVASGAAAAELAGFRVPDRVRVGDRELPLAVRRAKPETGAERKEDGRHVGRRVGMDDAASDRPQVAYLQVADPARTLGQRCECRPPERLRSDELVPSRERTDVHLAVAFLDAAEAEPRDVDDDGRPAVVHGTCLSPTPEIAPFRGTQHFGVRVS